MGVGGQRHAPAALRRGKRPVPVVYEAGWAPGPVRKGVKNLAPRSSDRPGRSELLYRLRYLGRLMTCPIQLLWILFLQLSTKYK